MLSNALGQRPPDTPAHDSAESSTAKTWDRISSHLFFAFFCAQILSPELAGRTLYLEVVVVALTPSFWAWFRKLHIPNAVAFFSIILLAVTIRVDLASGLELLTLALTVLYLYFRCVNGPFLFFHYLTVSILVAAIQFASIATGRPDIAILLGPTNLATAVWGDHATATFTNFYAVIGDQSRVAGLSRESGFLASLTVAAIVLRTVRGLEEKQSRVTILTLGSGWFLALSKMSFVLAPAWLVIKLQRALDALSPYLLVGIYLAALSTAAQLTETWLLRPGNETFLHRFGAFAVLNDLTSGSLLLGGETTSKYDFLLLVLRANFNSNAGLAGYVLEVGLIGLILWVAVLRALGFKSSAVLLVMICTLNVTPTTSQNFVAIAYLSGFLLSRRSVIE